MFLSRLVPWPSADISGKFFGDRPKGSLLSIGTKSVTLNGEVAFILRYFTQFGSFRGALRKSGWQNHNYEQFTITMSSSKRL